MSRFTVSRTIAASAKQAWEPLADVLAWPNWLPTVIAVEKLQGEALAVGSKFRVSQPRLRPQVWTVTEIVPNQHFTWESRSPGMTLRATHVVKPRGASACDVELAFQFSGPIGAVLGLFFGRITQKYIAAEADSLKSLVESQKRGQEPKTSA